LSYFLTSDAVFEPMRGTSLTSFKEIDRGS
jgi:hypothetical protein